MRLIMFSFTIVLSSGLTHAGLMHSHGLDRSQGMTKVVTKQTGAVCDTEQVNTLVEVARKKFLTDVETSESISPLIPFKKETLEILKKSNCVNVHDSLDEFVNAFVKDKEALGEPISFEEAKNFIIASGSSGFTAGSDNSIHIVVSDIQAEQQNHDLVHEIMHVMSAPAGVTNFKIFLGDNINEAFNDYFARIVLNEEKIDTLVRYPYLFIFGKLVAQAIGPENIAPYYFRSDKETDFFKTIIVDGLTKIGREQNKLSTGMTNPFTAKKSFEKSAETVLKKIQSTIGQLVIDKDSIKPNLHPFVVEAFFTWFITYKIFDEATYKKALEHLDIQLLQNL